MGTAPSARRAPEPGTTVRERGCAATRLASIGAFATALALAPALARAQGAPEGAVPVVIQPAPPAAPPPLRGVPIRIETGGEPVNVAIQTVGGPLPMCTAPCTLSVPRYGVYVITDGPGYPRMVHTVDVEGPTRFRLNRPSAGGIAGGSIMITVGSLAGVTGLISLLVGFVSIVTPSVNTGDIFLFSLSMLAVGGGLIGGGAVVVGQNTRRDLQNLGPIESVAPVATALPGGGGLVGLRLRF